MREILHIPASDLFLFKPCGFLAAILMLAAPAMLYSQGRVVDTVTNTGQPVDTFMDGESQWGWTSWNAEHLASALLDDIRPIQAELVVSSVPSAAYRLLGSTNYRDWYILSEGQGTVSTADRLPVLFESFDARFLRLEPLVQGETRWQLYAGPETEMLARFGTIEPVDWGDITDPEVIYPMLDLAFSWQVANQTDKHEGLGWMTGAFHSGISALYQATGDQKYRQAILDRGNQANWTLHDRGDLYHADDHCLGQAWLELYLVEPGPQEAWIADVRERIDTIMTNPHAGRTDYWWCDALYMSPPLYGRLAEITGDPAYQAFIDTRFRDAVDFLYNDAYHLFYRDANYFYSTEANGEPVFWSRGNGWVIAGVARMLQYMPADWPERPWYENLLREMATALAAIQDVDSGLWTSSLLYPERFDKEPETSGSAFFTFAMAYGINNGILDRETFGPVLEKAWAGLASMLRPDGQLLFIQQGGGQPARNNLEALRKDYGYGAFLQAGVEMVRYYTGPQGSHRSFALLESGTTIPAANAVGDPGSWLLVDDFENGFNWEVEAKDGNLPYVETGMFSDDDNAALVFWVPFEGSGCFFCEPVNRVHTETSIPPIEDGNVGTLYERFAFDDNEVSLWSFPISLPGFVVPTESGGEDFLQLETWYESWTVVDNINNRIERYIRGGSNFPQITRIDNGDGTFPQDDSDSFNYISLFLSGNLTRGSGYLDDVYVDPSERNLTRPAGVRQPVYSPWSDIGRDRDTLVKDTPVGPLWDQDFPWIYHGSLKWAYIWPQERYAGGCYAWIRQTERWIWISSAWPGWYYDFATSEWLAI